ncbi:Up-regulated during septation-domain-containing protein [Chaetomium tenue]|uniref:Up-regulated during septation-domain-containing protein n=1 Tax=Chaetomium tenue TaxID=1854479 RepID=A0ACB7PNI4_9PEZI|nr:Up-regulated during septation-domain-containing protein [Chaetomium globosum]
MAHIANCLEMDQEDLTIGLNNYIAAKTVTEESNEPLGRASPSGDKPFAWRMQPQKYQLFPKGKQTAAAPGKPLDPEQAQAFALARSQNGEKSERTANLHLKLRLNQREMRNRKISVSDLAPLTTVQEAAMDSPTIPGRPPVHERSISAPGSSWKQYALGDCMTSGRTRTLDERPELRSVYRSNEELQRPENEPRQPLSPKSLTPLVIPTSNPIAPHLARRISNSRLRSGSTPVDGPTRGARVDDSPRVRTPFTPVSAALTTPRSAATTVTTTSTLATPISAPADHRESPRPWERSTGHAATSAPKEVASERSTTPRAELSDPLQSLTLGHRRNQSESDSMINRGRPPRRLEICAGPATLKRSGSKRNKSSEGHAIEQLPKGWKAGDAVNIMSPSEIASLQRQALQQAARFEVLRKEDVDNLSRELRQLDERADYLRHTHTSLRSGRRNLHSRICQYLRSPRTAKFSHESILKQEEALAELDTSIDEWTTKLEHVENRRIRVRQKLLEHVAAAVTLGAPTGSVVGVSESLQFALGVVRPQNAELSTPPRSPVKTSFVHAVPSSSSSPHRAQVPSTILEQPLFEEAASMDAKDSMDAKQTVDAKDSTDAKNIPDAKNAEKGPPLRRAETIRVYAATDVYGAPDTYEAHDMYALMADVEDTVTKMGGCDAQTKDSCAVVSEAERRKLCRTLSHDVLSGGSVPSGGSIPRKPLPVPKLAEKPSSSSLTSSSPTSSSTSSTKSPLSVEPGTGEVLLTSAVFKP